MKVFDYILKILAPESPSAPPQLPRHWVRYQQAPHWHYANNADDYGAVAYCGARLPGTPYVSHSHPIFQICPQCSEIIEMGKSLSLYDDDTIDTLFQWVDRKLKSGAHHHIESLLQYAEVEYRKISIDMHVALLAITRPLASNQSRQSFLSCAERYMTEKVGLDRTERLIGGLK